MPAPKLLTSLPEASNFRIGSTFPSKQLCVRSRALVAPQRSPTQSLAPPLSASTPLTAPHIRPSGNIAQPSIIRYGLAYEFGSALVWTQARAPVSAPATTIG